jgi:hypothetical protein
VAAAVALVELAVLGTLALALVVIVVAIAQWCDGKGDWFGGFARSVLVVSGALGLMALGSRGLGAPAGTTVVRLLMVGLMIALVASQRLPQAPRADEAVVAAKHARLLVVSGPLLLVTVYAFSYVRNRGTIPWAMSGDMRNHVLIVRDTVEAGGIPVPGYPALGNAVAALVGGWRFDAGASGAGSLGAEVEAIALTMVLLLSAVSLVAVSLVRDAVGSRDVQVVVGTVVLGLLPLSQIWLHTYLYEGFMPTALAVAVTIAAASEVARPDSTVVWRVGGCTLAGIGVALTFPPLLPLLCAMIVWTLLTALSSGSAWSPWRQTVSVLGAALAIGVAGTLLLHLPSIESAARSRLDLYGRISSVEPWALPASAAVAIALLVLAGPAARSLASVTTLVGAAAVTADRFLERVLEASYYVDKTRWMSVFVMLTLLVATATALLRDSSAVGFRVAAGAVLGAVALVGTLPILQQVPSQPVLRTLATGWSLPSPDEAALIIDLNSREPRSVVWRISPEPLATRVIDIWLTSGLEETDTTVTWGYRADVLSSDAVCRFAAAHAPMTIWVPTDGAASVMDALCNGEGVSVEVVDR